MMNQVSMKMVAVLVGAIAMTFVVTGCGAGDVSSEELQLEELDSDLYKNGLTWPGGTVRVCYDPNDGNNPSLIADARLQLAAQWQRAANITFTGWGACSLTPSASGNYSTIALHFCHELSTSDRCPASMYDNRVRAKGKFRGWAPVMGRVSPVSSDGRTFTPGVTHVSLIGDDLDTAFWSRFRYEVIHEFGHALGYDHEQNRPDNFDDSGRWLFCNQGLSEATTGSNQTSFFDKQSIMNYCGINPVTGGIMTNISSGDILGVRVAYSRNPSFRGFMIKSDRNSGLAVNAYGGAAEGTVLKLHSGCNASLPDCTWTYQRGMLVSDKDPSLAINAWGGAADGTTLKLTRACTESNPDCTWTYKNGMFLSDRNPSLAINAWGGAVHGTTLVTAAGCAASNPDCTWTLPDVMLSSHRDLGLAVNAIGGAANQTALGLHNACTPTLGDCTFTFSKGMLISTTNTTLAVNAWGGAAQGTTVVTAAGCTASNPDCTWTWKRGQIISDNTTNGTFPINAVGGGIHGHMLKLASACTQTNPDCVFSGMFAK